MPRSATELLQDLKADGFTIAVVGDSLVVTPAARLTPALQDEMTRHGKAILALLRGETDKTTEPPVPRTHAEIRAAYKALNEERERQAAIASREAERRRERQRFERAQALWRQEDQAGRARRAQDLAEIFEAGDDRRGY